MINRFQLKILNYYKGAEVAGLIARVRSEVDCQILSTEGYVAYSLARSQVKRPGVMAEVGTYEGASAKLICEAKGDTEFHVFDTFEGLPECSDDDPLFRANDYASDESSVRKYLSSYPNVHFHKGCFPKDTGREVDDKQFSFVNLDVDIHESTRDSLAFFYPRMTPGGIILSHDYAQAAGVKRAFDEFFIAKPEPILELSESQCMVVKL